MGVHFMMKYMGNNQKNKEKQVWSNWSINSFSGPGGRLSLLSKNRANLTDSTPGPGDKRGLVNFPFRQNRGFLKMKKCLKLHKTMFLGGNKVKNN